MRQVEQDEKYNKTLFDRVAIKEIQLKNLHPHGIQSVDVPPPLMDDIDVPRIKNASSVTRLELECIKKKSVAPSRTSGKEIKYLTRKEVKER